MTDNKAIGHGVTLSSGLRNLMLTVKRTEGKDATLTSVDQLLRHSGDQTPNETLSGGEGTQLLTAGNVLTRDRNELGQEFSNIFEAWGKDYPVRDLLDADEQGVRTHEYLSNIDVGQAFQIGGSDDTDKGTRATQWIRRRVGQANVVNGLVPVQAIVADVVDGDVQLLDPSIVVRPLLKTSMGTAGAVLRTREEQHREMTLWADLQKTMLEMDDRVNRAVGRPDREAYVSYSAYGSDEQGRPIDNLDDVAVYGKVEFVAERDTSYGGEASQPYRSPVLENPTWLDLCVLANAMMETTGDFHHVFLDGIDEDKERTGQRHDGVRVYRFSMGS